MIYVLIIFSILSYIIYLLVINAKQKKIETKTTIKKIDEYIEILKQIVDDSDPCLDKSDINFINYKQTAVDLIKKLNVERNSKSPDFYSAYTGDIAVFKSKYYKLKFNLINKNFVIKNLSSQIEYNKEFIERNYLQIAKELSLIIEEFGDQYIDLNINDLMYYFNNNIENAKVQAKLSLGFAKNNLYKDMNFTKDRSISYLNKNKDKFNEIFALRKQLKIAKTSVSDSRKTLEIIRDATQKIVNKDGVSNKTKNKYITIAKEMDLFLSAQSSMKLTVAYSLLNSLIDSFGRVYSTAEGETLKYKFNVY
jgi:hypothetical protein